jgi:hypothetical protein
MMAATNCAPPADFSGVAHFCIKSVADCIEAAQLNLNIASEVVQSTRIESRIELGVIARAIFQNESAHAWPIARMGSLTHFLRRAL